MSSPCSTRKCILVMLILLLGISVAYGQTKQILTWKDSLEYSQKLSGKELESQRDDIARIRTAVEFWIRLHPNTTIKLAVAPAQPLNADQLKAEVTLLNDAVDIILKEDRVQSFNLGTTEVSVTAEVSLLSPVTDSLDNKELQQFHATNLAESINYLPGLSLDKKSNRNQSGIMIRGFDTRQVGLYLDGIPIYVPYDGYADISRFLTSDIGMIDVAKGYSSPLLGPNGLAGAVNVVTRQPEKKLEGDASIGGGSGELLESGFHIGSRWKQFFIKGGMDWTQQEFFPLSGDYKTNTMQPNYERVNSYRRDVRYNGRIGWTPRDGDQYVFTYNRQKADYGTSPYAPANPADPTTNTNYWRWGYWNRDSYYLNTNTNIGSKSSIKFRGFYDVYPNLLLLFSKDYASLTGYTPYDDHSEGFSTEFSTGILSRHTLSVSYFWKGDTHRERDFNVSGETITANPWRAERDTLTSIGLQDVMKLSANLRATVGLSFDHLKSVRAENLSSTSTVVPFCATGSATSCLLNEWAANPLASVSYAIRSSGNLFFTFAMKSHFPTLKDRYSYKNGQAVPNPGVSTEHARNYTLGYTHTFAANTVMQIELFRSDVYDVIGTAKIPSETNQCKKYMTGFCKQSANGGTQKHQGVEITLRTSPIRRLNFNTNYTFLRRDLDITGNLIELASAAMPKHKFVAGAVAELPHKIMALANIRYESGAFNFHYKTGAPVPASKFATTDLGGIFPIKNKLKFQVGIKNLFDRNYYYQEGFPEAGRTWYANTRFDF
jgi:iron complex outermembrane recepter protein